MGSWQGVDVFDDREVFASLTAAVAGSLAVLLADLIAHHTADHIADLLADDAFSVSLLLHPTARSAMRVRLVRSRVMGGR